MLLWWHIICYTVLCLRKCCGAIVCVPQKVGQACEPGRLCLTSFAHREDLDNAMGAGISSTLLCPCHCHKVCRSMVCRCRHERACPNVCAPHVGSLALDDKDVGVLQSLGQNLLAVQRLT